MRRALLAVLLSLAGLACTDPGARPTITLQSADTADQVLEGMQHYITENGVRRSLVEADTAYIYESTQTADLRKLKLTFFDDHGAQTSIITADEGTYLMRDGSMRARGNVVATTPDGRRLTSAMLDYDNKTNSISSDLPFISSWREVHSSSVTDRARRKAGSDVPTLRSSNASPAISKETTSPAEAPSAALAALGIVTRPRRG